MPMVYAARGLGGRIAFPGEKEFFLKMRQSRGTRRAAAHSENSPKTRRKPAGRKRCHHGAGLVARFFYNGPVVEKASVIA